MLKQLRHIHQRRKALNNVINIQKDFKLWEESCVPSYCHHNLAAAYISWWRLFKAVSLAKDVIENPKSKINALDFGASVGELGHLIPEWQYHYIESDESAIRQLKLFLPKAIQSDFTQLPDNYFDIIFALDSLEHNKDYATILEKIHKSLKKNGILVLSGPTENIFYKIGRKLAGFDGHYHETNIYTIENAAFHIMGKISTYSLPFIMPLFRISIWGQRQTSTTNEGNQP